MKNQTDQNYIIELIRQGKTNREIAGLIQTTEQGVKDRVHRLLKKINCKNRVQLSQVEIIPHGTI